VVSSRHFTVDMFDGYNLALLGDIHKRQDVQKYSEEFIEIDEEDLEEYLKKGWEIDK
jgi:hypothetical protein